MTKAQKALRELLEWGGTSEIDLYPYVRDFFTNLFGYPKSYVRLAEKGSQGKIPDVSLVSADIKPKDGIFWIVCEVKKERRIFRSEQYREKEWKKQLKNYVSADTVYALFLDPETLVIKRPDGIDLKVIELDKYSADELLSSTTDCSLTMLHFDNSISDISLSNFKEGLSPSRYLDVTNEDEKTKFYASLRVSAREFIDFSLVRLRFLHKQYKQYLDEIEEFNKKVGTIKDDSVELARNTIYQRYKESINIFERILKIFESQIGRQMPTKEEEARRFLINLYATEGSSLVLARILFIRFLEDHNMTNRKVSNGGIKAFRDYHRYIKDDYQFLLTTAYKDAERLYSRLFQPSIFDWSHEGDGQLSRILLRIFYRLNAFDFEKITGDILGNLYERFLDINSRKKLGEYYTPIYLARYILERIGFYENPAALIDPTCGSGTFLIAAITGLIERLISKGVKIDIAISQTIELIHGLDINVFAAFIAQLQLIWHLLPYLKRAHITELPELKIYGGVNSLVYINQQTLFASLLDLPTDLPAKIRDSKYRYVVGNPPYIRNERLKDTGTWRENYDFVDFRNSDVAYFFVARAIEGKKNKLPSWLEDNGKMCFVLPMGLCDSQAASKVREVLYKYRIFEITDLEDIAIHIFPSPQASGRATVAPVLVFVEKSYKKDHIVNLVHVFEDAIIHKKIDNSSMDISQIKKDIFYEGLINPFGQILPKIKQSDIPILEITMNHAKLSDFTVPPTPTYGITIGRAGSLYNEFKKRLLPLGKGLNISTFRINPNVSSWVDLNEVRSKSIWGKEVSENAYAVSIISRAPQCALFNPKNIAFNDSTLIMVPKTEYLNFPWDTIINSSVIRFIYLIVLRTALVGVGTLFKNKRRISWSHIYPRTISILPVSNRLFQEAKKLTNIRNKLSQLAESITTRWDKVIESLNNCSKKPLSLHNVDFTTWNSDIFEKVEYGLLRENENWTLRPYIDEQSTLLNLYGNYELLNVVKFLLENREEEGLTVRNLQNLPVPESPELVSELIDIARDPNSEDIQEFKKLFKKMDEIIAFSYGLTEDQWEYVQERLSTPPFDVLEPRWPWETVEMRKIQQYDVDRFA